MAFYDWNKDGKKDFTDDFIEYKIYEDCMKNDDEQKNSGYSYNNSYTYSRGNSSDSSGCMVWFLILVIIVILRSCS